MAVGLVSVPDARAQARRILPRPIFDFVDGGAEDEHTKARNARAFDRIGLLPRLGVAAASPTLTTSVLGRQLSLPILLAPCGEARLVHPSGAPGAARAAARAGTAAIISTFCGSTLEQVTASSNSGHWFQLYFLGGRHGAERLIERAEVAGYQALVVTLDTQTMGKRDRELRHRVTRPSRLDLKTAVSFAPSVLPHPRWLLRFARAGFPLGEPNLAGLADEAPLAMEDALAAWTATKLTWDDLAWVRERWPRPLVAKGVLTGSDARRAVEVGADAVVVSNHGGRQLEGAPATIDVLPEVVDAIGDDAEVLLDSGIQRGSHVVRALALGARAVLIGRAYLYGLAVSGEVGVAAILEILRDELARTLELMGCRSIAELDRSWLRVEQEVELL